MQRVRETPVQLESYRRNVGVYFIERHPQSGEHMTLVPTHIIGWDRDSVSIIPPLIFDEAKKKVSVDADQSRTCSP